MQDDLHFKLMKISIDVVIPSFRLNEKYLLPLLQLKKPVHAEVKYFLVVDNPDIQIPASLEDPGLGNEIFLIINPENLGVSKTRNVGIEAGNGEWILFLDDDIVADENLLFEYSKAISEHPDEIGFIGYTQFPKESTSFGKAIIASGSMDIFSVALRRDYFVWGATVNFMVKRKAIGPARFSDEFPKKGGGEDVDFFLNVRKENGNKNFKTLAVAKVEHPWWHGEKPDFERPFRYGKGNSLLGNRHKEYTYYDFLNTPETILILFVALLFFAIFKPGFLLPCTLFIAGIILTEFLASAVQYFKRRKSVEVLSVWYLTLLRLFQECGVLAGKLEKGQVWRIGERFHDDGKIKKIYFYRFNSYKITKWILYPGLIMWLYFKFY